MHGVRYTQFIGDGDSSVHPTLLQNVPGWGHAIRKLECANHACKCYRGALEQLIQNNPSYKGNGGLTVKIRKKLVSAARCAIRMRSEEADKVKALRSLRKDLVNGPCHVFGIHTNCSPDFCTVQRQRQQDPGTSNTGGENPAEENCSDVEQDHADGRSDGGENLTGGRAAGSCDGEDHDEDSGPEGTLQHLWN